MFFGWGKRKDEADHPATSAAKSSRARVRPASAASAPPAAPGSGRRAAHRRQDDAAAEAADSVAGAGATAGPAGPATGSSMAPADAFEGSSNRRKLIERLEAAPASQGILTIGAKAKVKLPRELEHRLTAIELGARRAAILYDPEAQNHTAFKATLANLRSRLYSEGYSFAEGGDYPCRPSVIKQLIDDYVSKNGSDVSAGDTNRIRSQARDRFLGWLDQAVRDGATDLHVQVIGGGRAIVQLRVDGELESLRDANRGVYSELEATEAMAWPFNSDASKGSNSSAQWDAARNLYCMTTPRAIGAKQISLRYQSLRGYMGPKLIARILNVDVNAPTLTYDQLGYADSQRQLMLEVSNMPSGFVLFSGVTGSGKTTSLKTFVETHPGNGAMAIYSIEDPVEYPMRGVHQIALQRDIADEAGSRRLYNEAVASLMRSDPDIVIVGELRDMATARAGQQIVETGHMALGTVHAHLIPGIIPRLTNEEIGMSRDVLTNPNMLSLLAYQALVAKLCPKCKLTPQQAFDAASERERQVKAVASDAEHILDVTRLIGDRFKLPAERLRYRNLSGCEHCNGRGTKGVTAVAEMMIPDRPWLDLTRDGKDYEAMVLYRQGSDKKFDSPDMAGKTIFEHTLYKAILGDVDARQCERFGSFSRFELAPELKIGK